MAVTVARPVAIAVASPVEAMEAVVVLEEDQATLLVRFSVLRSE